MAESPGALISFDGVDSSGKATQSSQLIERLQEQGLKVNTFQTPDYALPSGQKLKKLLQDPAAWRQKTWQEKITYFADNRAEHRAEVVEALTAGEIVIYDRYVPSSLTFIAVEAFNQGEPTEKRSTIQAAVAAYEYEHHHMPKEDLSIFLDVPPGTADKLLHHRKKMRHDQDEYTDHIAVQKQLYHEYQLLIANNPEQYLRVPCVPEGTLRSVEEIAQIVWQGILDRFPKVANG